MPACTIVCNTDRGHWMELDKAREGEMNTFRLKERTKIMVSLKAQLKFLSSNMSSTFTVISPSTFDSPSICKI